uniref:NADH dehydrogenase subunit 4L n=1 Tax=Onukigallia onukii TaxID=1792642 RepID=UPI0030027553|nr:NADH dehydrogenase subunit 4L [Onukigallia onukii]
MSLFFFMYIYFVGIFSLILIRKHILLCLLSLEFIVLYLLYLIYCYCLMYSFSFYLYLLLMTFYVCESCLGLGLLVLMIRSHGNDYLNSLILW